MASLELQLEKDPGCPWQVTGAWGLLKSGKWAKAKASPQDRLRQSFEAFLGSSQRFGFCPQLQLDTVCHVGPRRTSSCPWHGELEPVSLTGFPGGQRGVCVWGGSPPWEPSSALSPPGSHPARLPSTPWAACLARGSFVLGGMAGWGWGASQTLRRSPAAGPQGMGLETSELRGTQSSGQGGAQHPTVQQDRPTLQVLLQ